MTYQQQVRAIFPWMTPDVGVAVAIGSLLFLLILLFFWCEDD